MHIPRISVNIELILIFSYQMNFNTYFATSHAMRHFISFILLYWNRFLSVLWCFSERPRSLLDMRCSCKTERIAERTREIKFAFAKNTLHFDKHALCGIGCSLVHAAHIHTHMHILRIEQYIWSTTGQPAMQIYTIENDNIMFILLIIIIMQPFISVSRIRIRWERSSCCCCMQHSLDIQAYIYNMCRVLRLYARMTVAFATNCIVCRVLWMTWAYIISDVRVVYVSTRLYFIFHMQKLYRVACRFGPCARAFIIIMIDWICESCPFRFFWHRSIFFFLCQIFLDFFVVDGTHKNMHTTTHYKYVNNTYGVDATYAYQSYDYSVLWWADVLNPKNRMAETARLVNKKKCAKITWVGRIYDYL